MSVADSPGLAHIHGHDCSCGCGGRFAGQQGRREDPTRTKTARRRFAQHLRGRWDAIKFHINRGLIDNDALGLQSPDVGGTLEAQSGDLDREFEAHVDTDDDLTPGAGQFDFPSDADKAEAFEEWLNEVIDGEILEGYNGDRYIRQGYSRGIKHADSELREIDVDVPDQNVAAALQLPVHEDKLRLLYTRAFEELEGIAEAAAQEIRRELTEGLSQGKNPRDIARNINDRVEAVGKTRSTVMARTEVIRSHSEATLDRFESIAGDINITVRAEFQTAGDSRVCEICEGLEGRVYTIDEARGLIPVHPQCRCGLVPVGDSEATNAAQAAHQEDKREAFECEECSIPLAEARPRCIHCDLAAGTDLPVQDLREVAG